MDVPDIDTRRLKALYEVEEKNLCRLASRLDLIIGGGVLVSTNISVAKGVANGTAATVEQILLNEEEVRWSHAAQCFVIEADQVQGLVLRSHQKPFDSLELFPPLQRGRFPVTSLEKGRAVAAFKWSQGRMMPLRTVALSNCRFRVNQLPVVSKNVLTIHKVQGQTTENLVMLPLDDYADGRSGLLYVALSRVRSLQNIYLTEPLSEDPKFFTKRISIIRHMNNIRKKLVVPTSRKLDGLFADLGLSIQEPALSTSSEATSTVSSSQPALPLRLDSVDLSDGGESKG